MENALAKPIWQQSLFLETAGMIIGFLLLSTIVLYFLQKKKPRYKASWKSLQSWLLASPLLLGFIAMPQPWPYFVLFLVSILGAKTFFKMVGVYHRNWFVVVSYACIAAATYSTYKNWEDVFNLTPMFFLGLLCFVPMLRNSYKHMIQYISLSLLCFLFLGWGFLHVGLILHLEKGLYLLLYFFILSEFSYGAQNFFSLLLGKRKVISTISSRFTYEGLLISFSLTLLVAWSIRRLLVIKDEPYWIAAAFIACFFGKAGDVLISVVRKDLGIKDSGLFILGRDDTLARMEKYIFAAPVFYYTFKYWL